MGSVIFGWVCNALMACGPSAVNTRPITHQSQAVTVYQVNGSHPIVTQLTEEQIQNIGLNCHQKDLIIGYLETRMTNNTTNPEQLDSHTRRLNSIAKSKIWQLRTYC
jgi:hypothetical protein